MIIYPKISLIVAKSRNHVIGQDGKLPWHLSSDLKFFKSTTIGKPVLMGRVTWESLPFPLPGRPNLVLTRNPAYQSDKAEIFTDKKEMLGRAFEWAGLLGVSEIMIIGGAKIYDALMPFCDRLYITDVDVTIEGDAFFPILDAQNWNCVSEQSYPASQKDDHPFVIRIYERINQDVPLS